MMRSAFIAAFAAGAIAVPFNVARDVVTATEVDVVYATEIVTVTAGASPPSTTDADTGTTTATTVSHWGHHTWLTSSSSSSSTEAPSSSYVAPTTTSTYVAPTTTSTYVAPTTYAAPAVTEASSSPPPPPPSSTSVAPSSSSAASASSASPSTYSDKATLHHNIHRSNHSAPDIAWNQSLADTAQTIAESCYYAHNVKANGGGYGQNIAAGVEADNITTIITDLFYNGEIGWFDGLYGQASPDMTNFERWGHFSQIVWKDTTSFGCYTQDCSSQGLGNVGSDVSPYFTVCNYYGPGNFANEYGTNIGNPLGQPSAQWDQGISS